VSTHGMRSALLKDQHEGEGNMQWSEMLQLKCCTMDLAFYQKQTVWCWSCKSPSTHQWCARRAPHTRCPTLATGTYTPDPLHCPLLAGLDCIIHARSVTHRVHPQAPQAHYCPEFLPYLAAGRPSEYLLVMQEPRACMTAREVKFSEAINSRPRTWTTRSQQVHEGIGWGIGGMCEMYRGRSRRVLSSVSSIYYH
jgi:hypothetical protein